MGPVQNFLTAPVKGWPQVFSRHMTHKLRGIEKAISHLGAGVDILLLGFIFNQVLTYLGVPPLEAVTSTKPTLLSTLLKGRSWAAFTPNPVLPWTAATKRLIRPQLRQKLFAAAGLQGFLLELKGQMLCYCHSVPDLVWNQSYNGRQGTEPALSITYWHLLCAAL